MCGQELSGLRLTVPGYGKHGAASADSAMGRHVEICPCGGDDAIVNSAGHDGGRFLVASTSKNAEDKLPVRIGVLFLIIIATLRKKWNRKRVK